MTKSELKIAGILEDRRWKIQTTGWPDFLCVREKKNEWGSILGLEAMAVEIKHNGDQLTPTQLSCHQILRQLGVPVFVINTKNLEIPEEGKVLIDSGEALKYKKAATELKNRLKSLDWSVRSLEDQLSNVVIGFERTSGQAKRSLTNTDPEEMTKIKDSEYEQTHPPGSTYKPTEIVDLLVTDIEKKEETK